ncbi:MAG: hypothetical protein K9N55_17385 [Phycisphaerae bacterium]|nr:hypothetical protein [Phycisphaerae bacterium]
MVKLKTEKKYLAIVSLAALALLLLTVNIQRALAAPAAGQTIKSETVSRQFEYRVCTVQFSRVTFVNAVWMGKVQIADGNADVIVVNSCPMMYEYLQDAGNDGWELVACLSQRSGVNSNMSDDTTQTLFLKKER